MVQFDTKLAVVLRDDLARLAEDERDGLPRERDRGERARRRRRAVPGRVGQEYLPMFVQPVLVYEADAAALRRAYERAMSRDVELAVYTHELFETGHDEANRAAVAAVPADELDLVGIAFRADRKVVDKVVDRLRFDR